MGISTTTLAAKEWWYRVDEAGFEIKDLATGMDTFYRIYNNLGKAEGDGPERTVMLVKRAYWTSDRDEAYFAARRLLKEIPTTGFKRGTGKRLDPEIWRGTGVFQREVEPLFWDALGQVEKERKEMGEEAWKLNGVFDQKAREALEGDAELRKAKWHIRGTEEERAAARKPHDELRAAKQEEQEKLRGSFVYVVDDREI